MAERRATGECTPGADSRLRILEAASALMADRGFAGTSISAVSRRSGLPASSIYWHFESKAALLAEVVEDGARRWFQGLPRWDDLSGTPADRVEQMFARTAESLEAHPEFLRLLLLIALERREIDPESLAAIRRVRAMAQRGLRRTIETLLRSLDAAAPARAAGELATIALAMTDGIFVQHHVEPGSTDVRRLFELVHTALLALARERIARAHDPLARRAPA